MELFKIMLGNRKAEFSIIGIADLQNSSARFQGLMNGIPFMQSNDYDKVRNRILSAISLNTIKANAN